MISLLCVLHRRHFLPFATLTLSYSGFIRSAAQQAAKAAVFVDTVTPLSCSPSLQLYMPKSLNEGEGEASGCTEGVHFRSNSMNGRNGSIFVDPHPSPKGLLTVRFGSLNQYSVCLFRVDSCPCYFTYIESAPTSEFRATTDVRQMAGYDFWLAAVLPQSANSCPSRTASEGRLCINGHS